MKKKKVSETKQEAGIEEKNSPHSLQTFSHSSSTRFGIVTLILATMGVIISIDSLIKVKEWNNGLQTIKDQIEKHVAIEHHRLSTLETALQNVSQRQNEFNQQLRKYQTTLSTLAPLIQKKSEQEASTDVLSQLEKAYDWLEEAELDLRWSNDWQGALTLLNASDSVIVQMHLPDLEKVHSLLNESITTLSAIQPIKTVLLLEKIKTMSSTIKTLPSPAAAISATAKLSTESTKSNTESGWRALLNQGFEWIQKTVTIRPIPSNAISPQFQSRSMFDESVIMALQQAQWALLKRDEVLFDWSLEQVHQLINNGGALIDLNSTQVSTFLQELRFLEKQELRPPELPNLAPATQELRAYMDTLTVTLLGKV